MRNDDHDYVESLVNRAVGLMVLNLQSDDFLRFLDDLKRNPTPEAIAALARWNENLEEYLAKRVETSRQQSQSLATSSEPCQEARLEVTHEFVN